MTASFKETSSVEFENDIDSGLSTNELAPPFHSQWKSVIWVDFVKKIIKITCPVLVLVSIGCIVCCFLFNSKVVLMSCACAAAILLLLSGCLLLFYKCYTVKPSVQFV